jgi:hypothetical protein
MGLLTGVSAYVYATMSVGWSFCGNDDCHVLGFGKEELCDWSWLFIVFVASALFGCLSWQSISVRFIQSCICFTGIRTVVLWRFVSPLCRVWVFFACFSVSYQNCYVVRHWSHIWSNILPLRLVLERVFVPRLVYSIAWIAWTIALLWSRSIVEVQCWVGMIGLGWTLRWEPSFVSLWGGDQRFWTVCYHLVRRILANFLSYY